jgi:hypothetical protein
MFVFNNLADVDDRGIQALLREVSSDVLVLALKGADERVKEKIFKNMSKRASELLRDDLEAKGPVRVSDVETAQKEILTIARRMAEAGEIVLGGKGRGSDLRGDAVLCRSGLASRKGRAAPAILMSPQNAGAPAALSTPLLRGALVADGLST